MVGTRPMRAPACRAAARHARKSAIVLTISGVSIMRNISPSEAQRARIPEPIPAHTRMNAFRKAISDAFLADEDHFVEQLIPKARLSPGERAGTEALARELVTRT